MEGIDSERGPSVQAAIQLRDSGKLEEARRMLRDLHARSPEDAQFSLQCAWIHDLMGLEREALGFYGDAIEQGLEGDDLRDALHGQGSTLRCLGYHQEAIDVLRRGAELFPNAREFGPFLAMAYAGRGDCDLAVGLLLRELADTSADDDIVRYRRALSHYAEEFIAHGSPETL